jgi:hypothetical protein
MIGRTRAWRLLAARVLDDNAASWLARTSAPRPSFECNGFQGTAMPQYPGVYVGKCTSSVRSGQQQIDVEKRMGSRADFLAAGVLVDEASLT